MNKEVHPEKIQLVNDMLNDKVVGGYWNEFVRLGSHGGTFKQREDVFQQYADARDKYLGLKPLPKIFTPSQVNLRTRVY